VELGVVDAAGSTYWVRAAVRVEGGVSVDGVSGGEVAAATTTQRPGPRTTEAPDGGRPRARRRGGVYFAWGGADGAGGGRISNNGTC